MNDQSSSTVVVELTPAGRGAVAVVLVAGPEAVRAVDACFLPVSGRRFSDAAADRILLGRWGDPQGEELIACRRADGGVEVHCHGGVAAVRNVMDRLAAQGCSPMKWQDWVRQSTTDPIRAEAQIALAEAPTARTAGILLDQYSGALAGAVRAILDAAAAGDWAAAERGIDAMLAHRGVGMHLTSPWRVVLAGPPNVGKSSLMNAIAGYQRAIVSAEPGTTRDVVTISTAIAGWPVQLADTAGLRETTDAIESAGVARATAAMEAADLVLLVTDATDLTASVVGEVPAGKPVLRVLSKIDLRVSSQHAGKPLWDLFTSAVTGEGIDALISTIDRALVPSPPAEGAAVPFTEEIVAALESASQCVRANDSNALNGCLRPLLGR